MFEAVVSQVLAGYLGGYVKGIQKDQLKIGIWNEELLLEKVELIVEAFDYLQLPFSLKQGTIGKLSIKIPWKKLGWGPVIVVLENVFISACQRDENEWSSESVEKRELAAKMAKLNAAELTKISKRVRDDQTGQSFISYVSAKILDNIQVYIQDFHVVFVDIHHNLGNAIFGLRFSSLKVRTDSQKMDFPGSYVGKSKGGEVNKIVEILGLGVYCNSLDEEMCLLNVDGSDNFQSYFRDHAGAGGYNYIVSPTDFSVSLSVNRSSKIDGCPQYMISMQLTSMALSLDEIQLKQILSLWDHFSICALREKYGRYRPAPFAKCEGWQRRWWHYAQESVLADVRRRLKKYSWSNMGMRLNLRRKYVNLYKRKLELIRQHQIIDEDILLALEQLDKQCDVEDILNFRSVAEMKLQDSFMSFKPVNLESYPSEYMKGNADDSQHISSNAQSWLSWLSLGMLGAGGTASSSSFSGIVSDEIIKDIYEATEFHPSPFDMEKMDIENFIVFTVKIDIHETVFLIRSRKYGCVFADLLFGDSNVDLEVSNDFAAAGVVINSVKVTNPCKDVIILFSKQVASVENSPVDNHPAVSVQVRVPQQNRNMEVSVCCKALEVIWDYDFYQNLLGYLNSLLSFEFQSNRVLSSLNNFEDVGARLSSKVMYVLSANWRLIWDTTFSHISVIFPYKENFSLTLNMETLFCRSSSETKSIALPEDAALNNSVSEFLVAINHNMPKIFQLQDLYHHFELGVVNLEACMSAPSMSAHPITVLEKFNALSLLSMCLFFDEPSLRQMEVNCEVAPVEVSLSLSTCSVLSELLYSLSINNEGISVDPCEKVSCTFRCLVFLCFKHLTLCFNLKSDEESNTSIRFSLDDIISRCYVQDFLDLSLCVKMIIIESFVSTVGSESIVLCSSSADFSSKSFDRISHDDAFSDGCLQLHYHAQQDDSLFIHEYHLLFNDVDLHIHPKLFKLVHCFFKEIFGQTTSLTDLSVNGSYEQEKPIKYNLTDVFGISKFGFSNFYDPHLTYPGISLSRFPFITVQNTNILSSTESSFAFDIRDWESLQVNSTSDQHKQCSGFRKRSEIQKKIRGNQARFTRPVGSGNTSVNEVIIMDIQINRIKVNFHDTTSILLTISVPTCESLIFSDGMSCLDLFCSAEGLSVFSCRCSPSAQVLCSSVLANLAPILNLRARWEKAKENSSVCEISLGIQHVNFILPSEFLAMIIGYIMLPDWTIIQNVAEQEIIGGAEPWSYVTAFKLEILDSTLRLPFGCSTDNHFCLGLKLLYCSFLSGGNGIEDLDMLPHECRIETPGDVNLKIFNIFGHDIYASFHTTTSDMQLINFAGASISREINLIEKMDADLSIRLPSVRDFCAEQSPYPFFMRIRVKACDFMIADLDFFYSMEAITSLLDHYIAVGAKSEYYKYDELQMKQSKREITQKAATIYSSKIANAYIMEMRVDNICIRLKEVKPNNSLPEVIAEANVQFLLDASYVNNKRGSAKLFVLFLLLNSFDNSILLSSSSNVSEGHCSLFSNFTIPNMGKMDLFINVPYLDIWLYLSHWNKIVDHLYSSVKQPTGQSGLISICEVSDAASQGGCNSDGLCPLATDLDNSDDISLRLENFIVSLYFPLSVRNYLFEKSSYREHQDSFQDEFEKKELKFLMLTVRNRDAELTIGNTDMKLKSYTEEVKGFLGVLDHCNDNPSSFLLVSGVVMEADFVKTEQPDMHVNSEIHIESIDIMLSHEMFRFWPNVQAPRSQSTSHFPFSIDFKATLNKGSVLLNDGKWSCVGPILELLTRHAVVKARQNNLLSEVCISCEISVNYNNIQKVMWEAFVEPWGFEFRFIKDYESSISNFQGTSDIYLKSTHLLNLNVTEAMIEVISRVIWMVNDASKDIKLDLDSSNTRAQGNNDSHIRRKAPYILHNDTSLPLSFWVSCKEADETDFRNGSLVQGSLQPGCSIPIFTKESAVQKNKLHGSFHSSGYSLDKRDIDGPQHVISVQLEGSSCPSKPMSMDLVGISFFEANFSIYKESKLSEINRVNVGAENTISEALIFDGTNVTAVPVVFEVSMYSYTKLIRLYSKVILMNATSKPLELRFDIPFGISSKILGPVPPGGELALPVHLAESGKIRWRPVGSDHLWSDAYSLSSMLSKEYKTGISRLYVCYPTNHSSDPFRCCIAVEDYNLVSLGGSAKPAPTNEAKSRELYIHRLKVVTPVLFKNYLPTSFSLEIDSSGTIRSVFLPENGVVQLFHIDSAHDLLITIHMQGFRPVTTKLPRADTFMEILKENNLRCSISEKLAFYPDTSSGVVFISMEKTMDPCSGAREICMSVPFLLYNCTGIPFAIVDGDLDGKGNFCIIPSNYCLVEQDIFFPGEDGLSLVPLDSLKDPVKKNMHNYLLSRRQFSSPFLPKSTITSGIGKYPRKIFPCLPVYRRISSEGSILSETCDSDNKVVSKEIGKNSAVKPSIYSPSCYLPNGELMVRLHAYFPHLWAETSSSSDNWSTQFSLPPTSGSTTVIIPQPGTSSAFLTSVSSSPISGDLCGKPRVIIFQPRFVICNTCNKELCYKQKGTTCYGRLGVGQHFHLHWADRMRDLLISIRFNEMGWQWSGSFLPDCLGNTLVKMRNYISGEICMVHVEVHNADASSHDANTIVPTNGTSGTHLILLSNDNTGFMPYRIDNYSMERLRIYQQKCEMFETIVLPYTSCQYAWDEPTFPHRLTIDVPGEHILGTYSFDDVGEYKSASFPQNLEKPERIFFIAVHAESATKVITVIDSRFHNISDVTRTKCLQVGEQRIPCKEAQVEFSERIRVQISVGVSLVDSTPEELIYARAEDVMIIWLQHLDQQKISFQISSIQVDNQLRNSQYPVIISFGPDSSRNFVNQFNESKLQVLDENVSIEGIANESVLNISAAKWRKRESTLISFEYVNIRVSPLHIEIEERILIQLLDFLESVSLRSRGETLQNMNYFTEGLDHCDRATDPGHSLADEIKKNLNSRQYMCSMLPQLLLDNEVHPSLPNVIPIGAPWQMVFPLIKKQRKIYVEAFMISPLNITLSFSSTPLMRIKNNVQPGSLLGFSGMKLQRSLLALVDVEGARFHLREITLTHIMASRGSFQEILIRHYSRQLLHELYKVLGSAGVIGNPIGFARNVGIGIKDFFSVSAKDLVQSPSEVITDMAHGSKSLFNNTIYALSSAATQFTKAAHKGIMAFAIDDQTAISVENQRSELPSRGLLNEFFGGLTGLLQSPIKGAEKHGLPGVLSGIAMGTAGLVARPVASILEATGKTAQSIRNRSSPNQSKHCRIRLPRPVARHLPLLPYSWEEAIGTSVLLDCDENLLKNETLVLCKLLKQSGRFVVITKRLVLAVSSSALIGLGSPEFVGVADPNWAIDMEMALENVLHVDQSDEHVKIAGHTEKSVRQRTSTSRIRQWNQSTTGPLSHMNMEFSNKDDAKVFFDVLLYTIDQGESQSWGNHILQRTIQMKWS